MKGHSRERAALFVALLFCGLPRFAAAQEETVEWVETGRFGTGEGGASQVEQMDRIYTDKWLHAGVRFGPSLRIYTPPGDTPFTGGDGYGFSMDMAAQANLRILSFLSIQGEAVFTWDNASSSFSLQIPLVVQLNFFPGTFRFSPFFGAYYLAAMGKLKTSDSRTGEASSWSYADALPLGLTGGINGGMMLGPGMVFIDLRYAVDLGEPEAQNGDVKTYQRRMVSLSLGYEFGFFTRKGRNRP
jgi:hypothetical protein